MFLKKLFIFFFFFSAALYSDNSIYGIEIDDELIGDIEKLKRINNDFNKKNDENITRHSEDVFLDKKDNVKQNDDRSQVKKKSLKNFEIKIIDVNRTSNGIAIKNLQEAFRFYKQKDYELAILYYKKSLKDNPQSVEAQFGLGVTYQFLRQYDQAIDAYLKLIKNNYSRKKIVSNLLLCLQHKSYKNSLEILSSIDDKILGYSDILAQIGVIYIKTNNIPKAISTLLRAHELAPTNAIIAYDLGILFDRSKNIDYAKHFFDIAIKNNISNLLEEQDIKRLLERVQELDEQVKNEIKKNKNSK